MLDRTTGKQVKDQTAEHAAERSARASSGTSWAGRQIMLRPWRISQVLAMAAAALVVATPSKAYYHYVHFLAGAPNTPVPEAFDLSALPYKTITFFVSNTGPTSFGANDSDGIGAEPGEAGHRGVEFGAEFRLARGFRRT